MKKFKYLNVILGVIVLLSIGFVFYATTQIPHLTKKIEEQKLSASEIDSYLESKPSSVFVNKTAEDSFAVPFYNNSDSDSDSKHVYNSPEGPTMLSNTDQWEEAKLKSLYEELMQNEHGKEMNTLYKVYVHGEANEEAAGNHLNDNETIDFKINFPAIPDSCEISFEQEMGTINLYNGDVDNTVESMAFVLSHEYGHHYTFYYMFEDDMSALDSEYAKIRKIPEDKALIIRETENDFYLKNHHWYLQEIAADDYIQLMGSPTTKRIINYIDAFDRLYNKSDPWVYYSINGTPQENFLIPLAYETEGLYDYYYSFINGGTREKPVSHEKLPITITIQKKSKFHDLQSGPTTYIYYEISWNKPYNADDVVYTLVYYEPDNYDYVNSIKAVHSNETPLAYIGTVSYSAAGYTYYLDDELATGKKAFVVTATFPDGTIFKSEPVEYNFK